MRRRTSWYGPICTSGQAQYPKSGISQTESSPSRLEYDQIGPCAVGFGAKSSVVKMNSMLGRRWRSGKADRERWRELRVARARDAVTAIPP
jgi:hypothetical protein